MINVLLISERAEEYHDIRILLSQPIGSLNIALRWVNNFDRAYDELTRNSADVYILNYKLHDLQGLDILESAIENGCSSPVIIMGRGEDNIEDHAIKRGAANYLDKNKLTKEHLYRAIRYAQDRHEMQKELANLYKLRDKELQEIREQKNKIVDSINYAKYIQDALLVDRKKLRSIFGEFAIVNRPKDIVNGDFYFVEQVGTKKIISVADCTGHGVPGAFMSLLCNDLLIHAIKETLNPAEILHLVNNRLQEALNIDVTKLNDGMDIALCVYDSETQILEYAGAFRPLIIVRDKELIEIKADRHAIGRCIYEDKKQVCFNTKSIKIASGDTMYLYSDGISDQIGGEDGRKLTCKKLKEFFVEIADTPITAQSKLLDWYFLNWKNNHHQVDDVLLLGIRF